MGNLDISTVFKNLFVKTLQTFSVPDCPASDECISELKDPMLQTITYNHGFRNITFICKPLHKIHYAVSYKYFIALQQKTS
jgi:hypothetical protein